MEQIIEKSKISLFKILLADDDKTIRSVVETILNNFYVPVDLTCCENGFDAYEKFCRESFDLVILDLQMPLINGFECATKIRDMASNVPIIFMSASREVEKIEIGDMILKKPFSKTELISSIAIFDGRQSQYDLEETLEKYGRELGSTEAKQVLNSFYESTDKFLREFDYWYEQKNLAKIHSISHRYYSSVSALNNKNLMDICKRLQSTESLEESLRIFSQCKKHLEHLI